MSTDQWKKIIAEGWRFCETGCDGEINMVNADRTKLYEFSLDGERLIECGSITGGNFSYLQEKETSAVIQFLREYSDYRITIDLINTPVKKGLEIIIGRRDPYFIELKDFNNLYAKLLLSIGNVEQKVGGNN